MWTVLTPSGKLVGERVRSKSAYRLAQRTANDRRASRENAIMVIDPDGAIAYVWHVAEVA